MSSPSSNSKPLSSSSVMHTGFLGISIFLTLMCLPLASVTFSRTERQALLISYCGSLTSSVHASTTSAGAVNAHTLSTCSLVSSLYIPQGSQIILLTLQYCFNLFSICTLVSSGFLPLLSRQLSVTSIVPSPSVCIEPPSRTNGAALYP